MDDPSPMPQLPRAVTAGVDPGLPPKPATPRAPRALLRGTGLSPRSHSQRHGRLDRYVPNYDNRPGPWNPRPISQHPQNVRGRHSPLQGQDRRRTWDFSSTQQPSQTPWGSTYYPSSVPPRTIEHVPFRVAGAPLRSNSAARVEQSDHRDRAEQLGPLKSENQENRSRAGSHTKGDGGLADPFKTPTPELPTQHADHTTVSSAAPAAASGGPSIPAEPRSPAKNGTIAAPIKVESSPIPEPEIQNEVPVQQPEEAAASQGTPLIRKKKGKSAKLDIEKSPNKRKEPEVKSAAENVPPVNSSKKRKVKALKKEKAPRGQPVTHILEEDTFNEDSPRSLKKGNRFNKGRGDVETRDADKVRVPKKRKVSNKGQEDAETGNADIHVPKKRKISKSKPEPEQESIPSTNALSESKSPLFVLPTVVFPLKDSQSTMLIHICISFEYEFMKSSDDEYNPDRGFWQKVVAKFNRPYPNRPNKLNKVQFSDWRFARSFVAHLCMERYASTVGDDVPPIPRNQASLHTAIDSWNRIVNRRKFHRALKDCQTTFWNGFGSIPRIQEEMEKVVEAQIRTYNNVPTVDRIMADHEKLMSQLAKNVEAAVRADREAKNRAAEKAKRLQRQQAESVVEILSSDDSDTSSHSSAPIFKSHKGASQKRAVIPAKVRTTEERKKVGQRKGVKKETGSKRDVKKSSKKYKPIEVKDSDTSSSSSDEAPKRRKQQAGRKSRKA